MPMIHKLAAATTTVAVLGLPAPASASVTTTPPPECSCDFVVTPGRAYTISGSYQATGTVRAVAYTYSAGAGWRKWFTGTPYGPVPGWAPLATTTPAVPAGTERLGVVLAAATGTPAVRDVAVTAALPAQRPQVYRPALGKRSGLVTNSYAYRNPKKKDAARSAVWHVTAGSLFATNGTGDTGKIDDGVPGPHSAVSTGSSVFRMHTVRNDFTDVRVAFDLNIAYQTSTSYTPPSSYDGVHIWLRHKSQYELYAASVARRDGVVLIKKKCPGGPVNGGTYYTLGAEVRGVPIARNKWRQMAATVQNNPSGSVTVVLYVNGKAMVSAVDTGIGCAPIRGGAPIGIRGDNTRFRFKNVTVTRL
ncbi:hypothetical protein [Actinoplanes auranticolor]|uniref:3-keto-disaccharide hydrolase domain-containing protein n=1 Tax=Actinoplanes auranticolor TaxID=47988 RepID=A0A919SF20_9ACTN|nr:hypothetical protein [Actinoplanes auranticolor]GIM70641.1 hypothetical protein Aau02nite_41960 [Actinoplanes auranticolor]